MSKIVASHLGLHCLLRPVCVNTYMYSKYVTFCHIALYLYCRTSVRGLQTCTQPVISKTLGQSTQAVRNCVKFEVRQQIFQSKTQPLYNYESVRTNIRNHYRPNAWKRIHKHGLEKRLSTPSQRAILLRRFIKGRRHLCLTDRFMNDVIVKKQKGKRVNLFSPEIRKKVLKNRNIEYYRFDTYKKVHSNY